MRSTAERKSPRFFVINPVTDRRMEMRFESREPVQIRDNDTGQLRPAVGLDIGRRGMRLECPIPFDLNAIVHILFPTTPDSVQCFGRVAWSRASEEGNGYICGIEVQSWHGIIDGPDSWKNLKGTKIKKNRRRTVR